MPNNLSKVAPFADDMESIASRLDAAGIGGHPSRGHAAILRNLSGDLRSQASLGRMPHVYESINSSAEHGEVVEIGARQARALNRPLTMLEAVHAAKDDSTRLQALSNLKARAERHGYVIPEDSVVRLVDLNAALDKSGARTSERFSLKADMLRANLIAA